MRSIHIHISEQFMIEKQKGRRIVIYTKNTHIPCKRQVFQTLRLLHSRLAYCFEFLFSFLE
jgi:hypothetical protein